MSKNSTQIYTMFQNLFKITIIAKEKCFWWTLQNSIKTNENCRKIYYKI